MSYQIASSLLFIQNENGIQTFETDGSHQHQFLSVFHKLLRVEPILERGSKGEKSEFQLVWRLSVVTPTMSTLLRPIQDGKKKSLHEK